MLHWIVSSLIFLRWFTRIFSLWRGLGEGSRLDGVSPDGPGPLPRLSVIVPALNEETTTETAMRTLLALDYPDLEIIAVDDRSTDHTGEILDRLAAEDPRLRVVHVRELPHGWLGKNHALHLGASGACGDWLLFTDADIHFEPTALRRAVRRALASGADHLVVLPELIAVGFWEKVFMSFFWTMFAVRYKPWRVSDTKSRDHVGVGAFNLVRSGTYRRAGGHAGMPMEVLDDVKLGKRLKEAGARQECLFSGGLVRVRWLIGLRGIVEGLTKNMFAALHFNPAFALLATALILLFAVWPAAGLFVGPAGARILCAGTLACMVWSHASAPFTSRVSPLYGLGFPIAALLFAFIILRSMTRTYRQGGVVWRGTHYPLADLRKGLV